MASRKQQNFVCNIVSNKNRRYFHMCNFCCSISKWREKIVPIAYSGILLDSCLGGSVRIGHQVFVL